MSKADNLPNPKDFSVLRLLAVAFPLIVVGAFLTTTFFGYFRAGNLSAGVPPVGAFALFLPVLIICAALPAVRRRWPVARGELVILFSMLFMGISIAGSGLWFHFVPSQIEFHRSRDLDWAMAISPNTWPNYGNLLDQASAEDSNETAGVHWSWSNQDTTSIIDCPDGPGQCVQIIHTRGDEVSLVNLELAAGEAPNFVRPLTRYAVFARLRLDDPGSSPSMTLSAGIKPRRLLELASIRAQTRPNLRAPDRFVVAGMIEYKVPRNLTDRFYLTLAVKGKGTFYARDFSVISTEEVYRFFEGYKDATPQVYADLPGPEAGLARVRPPASSTFAYVKHVLFGLVPWDAWWRPLAMWGLFVTATFLAMFCLVTIFFRHWDDGERLTFPLTTFFLEITNADEHGRLAILRSKPFWIAMAACSVHLSLQQLNIYFPTVPHMNLSLPLADLLPEGQYRDALGGSWGNPAFAFSIHPLFMAVAFFISLEISLSMVVFYLASWVYRFAFYFTPLNVIRSASPHNFPRFPFSWLMTMGGLLFMACFTIFAARKHLARVAGKVLLGRTSIDDSSEALSYRVAVFGLVAAAGLYVAFAVGVDISPQFVLGYMAVHLSLSLVAARIRAETGLPSASIFVHYPQVILPGIGSALILGYREVVFTVEACFLYLGSFLMIAPLLAEAMASAKRTGVPLRKVGWCMMATFLLATLVGGIVTMSWGYTVGTLNMDPSLSSRRGAYNRMTEVVRGDDDLVAQYFGDHPEKRAILSPENAKAIGQFQPVTLIITAVSFAITAVLAVARVIWLGFPLHPLGFALAFTSPMADLWGSIAVAALVKHLGLRFGGIAFNRRILKPIFVGLFVSTLVTSLGWQIVRAVVNAVTGGVM